MAILRKRWLLRSADVSHVNELARELKLSPLIAKLLVQRGFPNVEAARRFLSSTLASDLPSPFLLAGMDEAVSRIIKALGQGHQICVWGDYDVDGTTGAAVLVSFLREIGARGNYYIPHRLDEGYGLSRSGLGKSTVARKLSAVRSFLMYK